MICQQDVKAQRLGNLMQAFSFRNKETSMTTAYEQHGVSFTGAGTRDSVALAARVLLVALFLMSGFGKIPGFAGTASYIAAKGLPLPELGAAIAIAVEVGGGLLVLVGWKARWAALVIAIYTVIAGVLFHAYWSDAPAARLGDYINFWKNVSIAGGFLMVFAFGPGRYSIERG
jgi:putative oxidoreductase